VQQKKFNYLINYSDFFRLSLQAQEETQMLQTTWLLKGSFWKSEFNNQTTPIKELWKLTFSFYFNCFFKQMMTENCCWEHEPTDRRWENELDLNFLGFFRWILDFTGILGFLFFLHLLLVVMVFGKWINLILDFYEIEWIVYSITFFSWKGGEQALRERNDIHINTPVDRCMRTTHLLFTNMRVIKHLKTWW